MASAQAILADSRILRVRELQAALEAQKRENARLREENALLTAHFHWALLAAEDLRTLPEGGRLILIDGWNMILGSPREAKDPAELQAKTRASLGPADRAWIVYDGPRECVAETADDRVRVSFTGGSGPHRADRLICDYLRAAAYLGLSGRIVVQTNDRDFRKIVARIQAR